MIWLKSALCILLCAVMLIPPLPAQAAAKKLKGYRFQSGVNFYSGGGFSEGLAAVCKDGKCGYTNKKGKYVIKPQYTEGSDFTGGIAVVRRSDGSWCFIDKTGKVVVE